MSLSVIQSNNGEALGGPKENQFVPYLMEHINAKSREGVKDILVFATELNEKQCLALEKELGWNVHFVPVFDNEDTHLAAFSNNPETLIDSHRYPEQLQNEHSRILNDDDGAKFMTVMSPLYAGTLQHLNPYAGDPNKSFFYRLQSMQDDGNEFRENQFGYAIGKLQNLYHDEYATIPQQKILDPLAIEFHAGYWNLFGSIRDDLILPGLFSSIQGDAPHKQRMALLNIMKMRTERGLSIVNPEDVNTYHTKKFGIPLQYKEISMLVSSFVDQSTKQKSYSPVFGGDRSIIVTDIELPIDRE